MQFELAELEKRLVAEGSRKSQLEQALQVCVCSPRRPFIHSAQRACIRLALRVSMRGPDVACASRAVLRGTRVLAGCSGHSQGTHKVLAAYSQRTHRVLTQDSRGIVSVHAARRRPGPQDTKEELVQSSALLQALQQRPAIPRDDQALGLALSLPFRKRFVHAVGDSGALR